MNKVITTCHYNRPKCTERLLTSIVRSVNSQNYEVICCVEKFCPKVVKVIESFKDKLNLTIIHNDSILGLWENKKRALSLGFERSDYVIHLEDDLEISKDCLLYFEQMEKYGFDDRFFSVSAYNNHLDFDTIKDRLHDVSRRLWYTPWGFALWRDRWEEIEGWNGSDTQLNEKFRRQRFELYPLISRIQNWSQDCGETIVRTNSKGDEVLKLNDETWKSRQPRDLYEQECFVRYFADVLDYEIQDFVVT